MESIELYTKQVAEFIQNRLKKIRTGDAGRRERLFYQILSFILLVICSNDFS